MLPIKERARILVDQMKVNEKLNYQITKLYLFMVLFPRKIN